ncbi:cupin domain-containing protein [Nitrincola sp. MINF-07-Sa-05]|uniref:cupin domain-containing protein n=1 Tax=Nitrincola salilacus TaxID=3400273 RepID=UPI0039181444
MLTTSKHFPLDQATADFVSNPRPTEIIPGVTKLSNLAFSTENLQLRYYQPGEIDRQVPHNQEELYVVVCGEAQLEYDGGLYHCRTGDAAYVPKMAEHRFIDATDDFAVWVIYFDA